MFSVHLQYRLIRFVIFSFSNNIVITYCNSLIVFERLERISVFIRFVSIDSGRVLLFHSRTNRGKNNRSINFFLSPTTVRSPASNTVRPLFRFPSSAAAYPIPPPPSRDRKANTYAAARRSGKLSFNPTVGFVPAQADTGGRTDERTTGSAGRRTRTIIVILFFRRDRVLFFCVFPH